MVTTLCALSTQPSRKNTLNWQLECLNFEHYSNVDLLNDFKHILLFSGIYLAYILTISHYDYNFRCHKSYKIYSKRPIEGSVEFPSIFAIYEYNIALNNE